jgi:hypothetical protein
MMYYRKMHHKFYQTTTMALCSFRIQSNLYCGVTHQQAGPTHLYQQFQHYCSMTYLYISRVLPLFPGFLCFASLFSASLSTLCLARETASPLVLPEVELAVRWAKIFLSDMPFSMKNFANLWTIISRLQHVILTLFRLVHENELPCGSMPTLLLKA